MSHFDGAAICTIYANCYAVDGRPKGAIKPLAEITNLGRRYAELQSDSALLREVRTHWAGTTRTDTALSWTRFCGDNGDLPRRPAEPP